MAKILTSPYLTREQALCFSLELEVAVAEAVVWTHELAISGGSAVSWSVNANGRRELDVETEPWGCIISHDFDRVGPELRVVRVDHLGRPCTKTSRTETHTQLWYMITPRSFHIQMKRTPRDPASLLGPSSFYQFVHQVPNPQKGPDQRARRPSRCSIDHEYTPIALCSHPRGRRDARVKITGNAKQENDHE